MSRAPSQMAALCTFEHVLVHSLHSFYAYGSLRGPLCFKTTGKTSMYMVLMEGQQATSNHMSAMQH